MISMLALLFNGAADWTMSLSEKPCHMKLQAALYSFACPMANLKSASLYGVVLLPSLMDKGSQASMPFKVACSRMFTRICWTSLKMLTLGGPEGRLATARLVFTCARLLAMCYRPPPGQSRAQIEH